VAKILNVAEWDATKSALDYDAIAPGLEERFVTDFEATFFLRPRWGSCRSAGWIFHALFRVFQCRLKSNHVLWATRRKMLSALILLLLSASLIGAVFIGPLF
jgi:hypothetical protein